MWFPSELHDQTKGTWTTRQSSCVDLCLSPGSHLFHHQSRHRLCSLVWCIRAWRRRVTWWKRHISVPHATYWKSGLSNRLCCQVYRGLPSGIPLWRSCATLYVGLQTGISWERWCREEFHCFDWDLYSGQFRICCSLGAYECFVHPWTDSFHKKYDSVRPLTFSFKKYSWRKLETDIHFHSTFDISVLVPIDQKRKTYGPDTELIPRGCTKLASQNSAEKD